MAQELGMADSKSILTAFPDATLKTPLFGLRPLLPTKHKSAGLGCAWTLE